MQAITHPCSNSSSNSSSSSNKQQATMDSPRLRANAASSPEFEFLLVGDKADGDVFLTADELFLDGVLLPLHHLPVVTNSQETQQANAQNQEPPPESESAGDAAPPAPQQHLKKWMDLFKVSERSLEELRARRRRQPRDSAGSAAELNINIWPFSRSRSAGNAATNSGKARPAATPAIAGGHRKASSAPCSRSNSRGESNKQAPPAASTAKKWSPIAGKVGSVGGVHLGRTNPVWKLRRKINIPLRQQNDHAKLESNAKKLSPNQTNASTSTSSTSVGARVINFNVHTCIGYRNQVSCSVDHVSKLMSSCREAGEHAAGDAGARDDDEVGDQCHQSGNNSRSLLINLRTIFSKKVY